MRILHGFWPNCTVGWGAPPTSLCSPSLHPTYSSARCCRGLLLLRLDTPPLHSVTAAAVAAAAAAARPAGSESSLPVSAALSPVINLSREAGGLAGEA